MSINQGKITPSLLIVRIESCKITATVINTESSVETIKYTQLMNSKAEVVLLQLTDQCVVKH